MGNDPRPKPYSKYPPNVRRMLMRRDGDIAVLRAVRSELLNELEILKDDFHAVFRERDQLAAEVDRMKRNEAHANATAADRLNDIKRLPAELEALKQVTAPPPTGCCGEDGPQTFTATVTVERGAVWMHSKPLDVPPPATEVVTVDARVQPIEAWHVAILPFNVWPVVQTRWLDHGGEATWAWGDLLPDPDVTNTPHLPPLPLSLPDPPPAPWPVRLWRRLVWGDTTVHAPAVPDSPCGQKAVLVGGWVHARLDATDGGVGKYVWCGHDDAPVYTHDIYPTPPVTWRPA